ncbi:MAG TPA: class I SAM-dependent methyltransferase, partial [Polymorphobacter sp.]|nr:class I SAM-dependent methyltransferase [Polymorphobacter sp.]
MWLLDRLLRRAIIDGELILTDAGGKVHRYGTPSAQFPTVKGRLTDNSAAWAIGRNPVLGAGEAWMDGKLILEQGDILDLLKLVTYNTRWDKDNPTRVALWRQQAIGAKLDQINFARRSKRNVAHHYDLSDRLYDLFLDADRQYSCAYYTDPANTLEQAQADKKAHIAAKLDLKPGQKVLDIGCGWGGMALYIHRVSGAEVLGVTLSEEQLKVARRRAEEAGVADKVKFELIDYRALTGQFDRIVSVGM